MRAIRRCQIGKIGQDAVNPRQYALKGDHMRRTILSRLFFPLIAIYLLAPTQVLRAADEPAKATSYTLTPLNVNMGGPLAISDRGEVLIQRQLITGAQPAPLIINKDGKETPPFDCQSETESSAEGSAVNNRGDVVGTCGGLRPFGFVTNLESGLVNALRYPGAQTTWGYGINDMGQAVGFYANQPQPPLCCFLPPRHLHSYLFNSATGEYRTIDHPFSVATGWPTFLTHINNKGQIAGYHLDETYAPTINAYSFIYENGTFTPVRHPRAWDDHSTFIYGLNNLGEIFGAYSGPGCGRCLFLYDGAKYVDVILPIPDNAPYPKDMSVSPAATRNFAGLNDRGQFVGTYSRILEWKPDLVYLPGEFVPAKVEVVNFIATPQEVLNDFVSFTGSNSSFQTTADTFGCPAGFVGKFNFDASLTNTGQNPLAHLMIQAKELTNGNVLQNADYAPGGAGATLSAFKDPSDADRVVSPGESVDIHFSVCLKDYKPFEFFVDVLGLTRH